MIFHKMFGWLYIIAGLFLIIFIAGQLLLHIAVLIVGILFVVHGIKKLSSRSMHHGFFRMKYLYDRWFNS